MDYFDADELFLMKDPRLAGIKKHKGKVSTEDEEDIDWDHYWEVVRILFPSKEEHVPSRVIGKDPMDLETVEAVTEDKMVNSIRRLGLKLMTKPGQCMLASVLCRKVAIRELIIKYRMGKIEKPDRDHVRLMTGNLVQRAKKGLREKCDPLICFMKNGRVVIKRKW